MKKKQLLRFQFLTLAFVLWGVSALAKTSHSDLLSSHREQTKIASSHFHHSLFVEELSSVHGNGEKNLDIEPHSSFLYYRFLATTGPKTGLAALQFTLRDKRCSVLRLLFPFHFFF